VVNANSRTNQHKYNVWSKGIPAGDPALASSASFAPAFLRLARAPSVCWMLLRLAFDGKAFCPPFVSLPA
jgi:hypothetical protein